MNRKRFEAFMVPDYARERESAFYFIYEALLELDARLTARERPAPPPAPASAPEPEP